MLSPVFEVKLVPKSPESSIVSIIVRVDDPVNLDDSDKLLTFMETQFPMYRVEHIIAGYKQVVEAK
jgi:hypothetical protein